MNEKYTKAVVAMIKANRKHRRVIESIVESTGIHRSQHQLLMHIARNNRFDSQKKIAACMGISPAAVTNCLSTLDKLGYITRHSGEDGRYNEIEITDAGKEIVERSRAKFSQIDAEIFSGFSDEEIAMVEDFLSRIENNADRLLNKKEKNYDEMV